MTGFRRNEGMIWILLASLILIYESPGQSRAEIFKYTDRQGNTSYTNKRSKIPKEYQKNVEIIEEDKLPPLHVVPDTPATVPIKKTSENWHLNTKVMVCILPIILGIAMFLFFFLKGFKNPMVRFGLKMIIAGVVSIGICTYILFQINQIQSGGSKNSKNETLDIFPINKVQREVKKIEENIKKQEKILKSISAEDD